MKEGLKPILEELYERYNDRRFVSPDPLEVLMHYDSPGDREVVGLIASSLAYGRVSQILASIRAVLSRMESPAEFLARSTLPELQCLYTDFKHRWTTGQELSNMLFGIGEAIREFGSLEGCFAAGCSASDETVLPALTKFTAKLNGYADVEKSSLLPNPALGSACKRPNLYLRWMVRNDKVDQGIWKCVTADKLIVPLDTHMHRISRAMALTARKAADLKTALEVTDAFRKISPDDPVKYDFSLTRLGIRTDADLDNFLQKCAA